MNQPRKLTETEKVRRAARKIEKRQAAELGPLFSDQVEAVDEAALLYQRRRGWSSMVEHLQGLMDSQYILGPLYTEYLRRLARESLPAELFVRLHEHCLRTYRCPTYHAEYWRGVLCGERVVFAWKRVEDTSLPLGFRAVPDGVFPPDGWTPPFTREQIKHHFWSKCDLCKMWHAPEQAGCIEDASVMANMPTQERS